MSVSGAPGQRNWRPRWQGLDWGLLVLGGLALFAASPFGQVIGIVAMIVIIGLPIYVLLALLPSVFFVYLFVRLVAHGWGAWRAGSYLWAALFALLAIAMADFFVFGAWRENARLDAQVAALRAEDRDQLGAPAKADTLALVTNSRNERDSENACGELCQRLLLNGEAKRILVHITAPERLTERLRKQVGSRRVQTIAQWPQLAFTAEAHGRLYWLQPGTPCGDIKIPENTGQLNLPPREKSRGTTFVRDASSAAAMRLRIANGDCLMSQDANLSQADAALVYGTLTSGDGEYAAAHDAHADTINAWRVAFVERRNGAFVETYRQTSARYLRFPYARVISYVHGSEFNMKTGYVRTYAQAGPASRFADRPGVEVFAIDRLGLRLHLDEKAGPAGGGDALARILSSQGALNEIDSKVVQDYIGHINSKWSARDFRLADDDVARILKIAADRRIIVPWSFAGPVALVSRDAPASAAELADLLFARLAEFADTPPSDGASGAWTERIRSLTSSMARLPDDVLRQRRAEIVRLSQTPGKRDAARYLINRMDVFGPEIVPDLLAMLDSATSELGERKGRRSSDNGAEAYAAALRNLCKLGDRASFALPMLRERAMAPDTPLLRRQRDVVIATFARMGASEDDVRALMKVDTADEKAVRNFDIAWRRARREPCD